MIQNFFELVTHIDFHEWLNILVRWGHLLAGIMWIGSSFYFVWLDGALEKPKTPKDGVEGELWMVHSGGFYQVEKRLIRPGEVPPNLHWFKWEATFTWITGFVLLWIVYYTTGGIYLIDPNVSKLTAGQATGLGVGLLAGSWFFYDLLYRSKLSKTAVANVIALLFVGGVTYALTHLLSGRAAFLHIGAMFGTWMVLNVWVHILPNQQKMIDATQAGKIPDYELGKKAKTRSMHNSYMTLPVLFIMISNHFATTYAHQYNWIVLLLLIFMGATTRVAMLTKSKPMIASATISLLMVIIMTSKSASAVFSKQEFAFSNEIVPEEKIMAIVQTRCLSCHSSHNTDDVFKQPPNGAVFENFNVFKSYSAKVKERVVDLKTMPLGNKTGMTDEERAQVAQWLKQQQ